MEKRIFETEIAGEKLTAEFSQLANQTNGSVIVRHGETVILANVVMANKPREYTDYFPLTVDYEEKFYAAGRILGSRFMRREGKPSEEAVLMCRIIDRTIRPLFDQRLRYDIQVVVLALSVDEKNDPDVPAVLGASLALLTSDIPWAGPVSAVRIAQVGDEILINPTYEKREMSAFDVIVCGPSGTINMIEGKGDNAKEENLLKGFDKAQKEIDKLNEFQKDIFRQISKAKIQTKIEELPTDLENVFIKKYAAKLTNALSEPKSKADFHEGLNILKDEWTLEALTAYPSASKDVLYDRFENEIDKIIHKNVLEKDKRPDGRKLDEIRPLLAEISILPRTHGSGLFFRGDTHILSTVTLGPPCDELLIEGMEVRAKKSFIHHYNFPNFSVGETGRMGGPGRREIGHGALAEKALEAVIPKKEDFPYTIRIVSETMSSNGSSSMGSVCASTLALMDAGVPIKNPVAGISIGLMLSDKGSFKILTDIQGPEDHHGDMDFKVAGTKEGITAIQMDIKVNGVTNEILRKAFESAKKARIEIINEILKTIPKPKESLSVHAPRVIVHMINPDKIRDVIGPGGKTINLILRETGAQIDVEQDGRVFITGRNEQSANQALKRVKDLTKEYIVGEISQGKVTRLFDFGAMVEIGPSQEGLVHVSELAPFRVQHPSQVVKVGDIVSVKIVGIDELGRINLSMKAVQNKPLN